MFRLNRHLLGSMSSNQTHFEALREAAKRHNGHLRLGLLTNQTGLDRDGRRTIDILLHSVPEVELKTLVLAGAWSFGCERYDEDWSMMLTLSTQLPGPRPLRLRNPSNAARSPQLFRDLDAVVIDLQDVGVRFFTYEVVVELLPRGRRAGACRDHFAGPVRTLSAE